jgi:hypothetical protein
MSDPLYMLRWPSRSYSSRYTVILVTSRDSNHITWFRNLASVSLLATLSHRTWVANDFSSSQFSQKRSKISDCTFWKISYKRKISFLLISCTRKWHSTVIESYIRRDDVIRCELDLALTEADSLLSFHNSVSRDDSINFETLYSISRTMRNWTNLSLISDLVRSSIIIWSMNM